MTTDYPQTDVEPAPGARLGLPASGSGSVAGVGRRLLGMVCDIVISYAVAALFAGPTPGGWASLVFFVESVALLSVAGQTAGMAVVRVHVVSLSHPRVEPWWAAVRTLLLLLLVPAVVWDADRRGLHDKASGVVVLNN